MEKLLWVSEYQIGFGLLSLFNGQQERGVGACLET